MRCCCPRDPLPCSRPARGPHGRTPRPPLPRHGAAGKGRAGAAQDREGEVRVSVHKVTQTRVVKKVEEVALQSPRDPSQENEPRLRPRIYPRHSRDTCLSPATPAERDVPCLGVGVVGGVSLSSAASSRGLLGLLPPGGGSAPPPPAARAHRPP